MKLAEELAEEWRSRLESDSPNYSESTRESIASWLLGENPERFDTLSAEEVTIARAAMDFRWRILRDRYLGATPEQAYQHLIRRLGACVLLREKIRTWVALSRDRQRAVADVVQEVIQEMLQGDRYLQQQMAWIARCTPDKRLRNALLFAATEEYCLRPIRNQPLLAYRFVNYLRRIQRGGLTQLPVGEFIRLVSEEITPIETEEPVSLLDGAALAQYEDARAWEEKLLLRDAVRRDFETYLAQTLGSTAVEWLELYLQGCSQEAIAAALNLPIKQVYRLREKISYHAIRVFALKIKPELVATWLETSLTEHGFGLRAAQWQNYSDSLTPLQRQLLQLLKGGHSLEAIGKTLNLKRDRLFSEWTKIYLAAQSWRNA